MAVDTREGLRDNGPWLFQSSIYGHGFPGERNPR